MASAPSRSKVLKASAQLSLIVVVILAGLMYADTAHAKTKDRIMREARSWAGYPYGKGPNGLTCSEYTRLVFGPSTGVWMPSWDDKQTRYGVPVKYPERGDLVWFHEPGYGKSYGRATHVAVYSGGGYVWHSSSYWGEVTKTPMMYIEGYRGARRIR
jgi:cell wall-associated NlpC family hydrolase